MNFVKYVFFVIVIFLQMQVPSSAQSNKNVLSQNLQFGGTAYDYLAYREWSNYWTSQNPLQIMKDNGFNWIRVGVLTTSNQLLANTPYSDWPSLGWHDEFWCSREYAGRVLQESEQIGLNKSVFFYFSDQAATAGQQTCPADWAEYNLEQTATAMYNHCFETVNYFNSKNINVKTYEMGNEIEYGICGFTPGDKITQWDGQGLYLDYLRDSVWSKEAVLLKAAISGTKSADSTAQIVLHIDSIGWLDDIQLAFYDYMKSNSVEFDFIGLSYYTTGFPPGAPPTNPVSFGDFFQLCSQLEIENNKKIIISEFSYPSSFVDGMGDNYSDYLFTEEGQASYISDFIEQCKLDTNIANIFYFYPDYQPAIDPVSGAYGLFQNDSIAKPAMASIRDAVTSVDNNNPQISDFFTLSQNYPNPFNPSTTINDSLPEGGNVTLKIFDVLGQEVTMLVNKKQIQGNYEVKFNAGNLSSGIYFYRLKAGNFSQTNKMILLK